MSKVNRRAFLKSSAAAGATVFLCGAAAPRALGANDRLRIAVAGVNGRGGSHISGWLEQPNVEIAYLIDPDQRHNMDHLAESLLDYSPIPITMLIGTSLSKPFSGMLYKAQVSLTRSLCVDPLTSISRYRSVDVPASSRRFAAAPKRAKSLCVMTRMIGTPIGWLKTPEASGR